ncbi:MAG: carboxypeptidase regulatory-like domain-containing protein [Saprospiraceae bacterium]|nr:carboxypeptidase regulatory-like domain-containing protein [Saprospiraceae bacterium]
MRILLLFVLALTSDFLFAQTLRGILSDADNGEPIVGATVQLQYLRSKASPVSLATSPDGSFVFESIRPGYYSLGVTAQGYENKTITEINVVSGKEQILELSLRRSNAQLSEVTILGTQPGKRPLLPLDEIPLTKDQTLRLPAMFFDPARLAMAYPGVAQTDDGTNNMSIRGNSPLSMRWRLEGVDIVNPNHLPNAGTFGDRASASGGGVLMFSAQLLDNSSLLTGAMPAGYGDALGGVMDMNLRKGNTQQHEFTAQAGLIGLDLAAEGPLAGKSSSNPASYLVNYRYSTVGLLGQMGVSFGDEQINFQDLSFNLFKEGKNGSRWTFFGMGGLNENIFRHKTDTAEIKFYKDFFDIDYQSKTGIAGASNWTPLSRKSWIKTTIAASAQMTERSAVSQEYPDDKSYDDIRESKLSGAITYFQRLHPRWKLYSGINITHQKYVADSRQNQVSILSKDHQYLQMQPWVSLQWMSRQEKTQIQAGFHGNGYGNPYASSSASQNQYFFAPEPRLSITQMLAPEHSISASAGLYSQLPAQWLLNRQHEFQQAAKYCLAYEWSPNVQWNLKMEGFLQVIQREYFVTDFRTFGLGLNNISEFAPYQANSFLSTVQGDTKGLEASLERRLVNGWFMMINATLLSGQYRLDEGADLAPSRWNVGKIANLVFGKEWQKEKRPGKERTIGINGRVIWMGGVREPVVDLELSRLNNTTIYNYANGYDQQSADYFRADLRVYWRRDLGNRRSSTFALDIQNLTAQENVAYHFYDPYTDKIETKLQLTTIPNFSWRLQF